MDRETLLTRLRGREWTDFEVKEAAFAVPRSAYATVSAFANTGGGWLVFGVAERGGVYEIVGVTDPDTVQNDFLGACRSGEKFSHPIDVRASGFDIEGRAVLAFHIPTAGRFERPIRVRIEKAWQSYVRLGGGDYQCNPHEEARFLRDADAEAHDAVVLLERGFSDLDAHSVAWLRAMAQPRTSNADPTLTHEAWLTRYGLLRDSKATRAAVLLCGDLPAIIALNPSPRVDFRLMHYRQSEPVPRHRWHDREVCDGNLVQALRALLERFERLVPNAFALEADGFTRRAHGPQFPVLREALINLLVHQDHGDQYRIARILWYADRVIFENPGDALISAEELRQGGASTPRNPLIARMIRLAGFSEQTGLGITTMREQWRALEGQEPVVVNDRAQKSYRIEFPLGAMLGDENTEIVPPTGEVTGEVTPQVTPQVERLLAVCDDEPTREVIQDRLGISDRKHLRATYLEPALAAGLIEMTQPESPRSPTQRYRLTPAGRALRKEAP